MGFPLPHFLALAFVLKMSPPERASSWKGDPWALPGLLSDAGVGYPIRKVALFSTA